MFALEAFLAKYMTSKGFNKATLLGLIPKMP